MGGSIEGLTAESVRGTAYGLEQFPFGGELSDNVMLGVGAVDGVVRGDGDAVGAAEDAVAPGGQEGAVPVEDNDGVLAASIDEDAALGVNDGSGAVAEYETFGQAGPSFNNGVAPVAASQNRGHAHLQPILKASIA